MNPETYQFKWHFTKKYSLLASLIESLPLFHIKKPQKLNQQTTNSMVKCDFFFWQKLYVNMQSKQVN